MRNLNHDISIIQADTPPILSTTVDWMLALEHRLIRSERVNLAQVVTPSPATPSRRPADLVVDLANSGTAHAAPVLSLAFDNQKDPSAILRAVIDRDLPDIAVIRNGAEVVAFARPMVDTPASTVLALSDVLARAITVTVSAVTQFQQGRLHSSGPYAPSPPSRHTGLLSTYAFRALPRLVREVARRLRYRQAHWRVGYRLVPGAGVADTGRLGTGWSVLPDSGDRFFADPFAFHHGGKTYVFVEDYSHQKGQAVISVCELDAQNRLGDPVPVIEETYHLSYPQVFERDGNIWMLPESSSGKNLVLYRATHFPHAWERHAVLLDGFEISDATLLDQGDRLWLFATERDGFGSTSDTLVVYSAKTLAGPWLPHKHNPIHIDRARARPGGAFVRLGDRIILPMQDGTTGYGGHLGLCDLLALDDEQVVLSPVRPIESDGDWPYPRIHSLNRAGMLEVIDGIAPPPRRRRL